jgi:hypothetical protein
MIEVAKVNSQKSADLQQLTAMRGMTSREAADLQSAI